MSRKQRQKREAIKSRKLKQKRERISRQLYIVDEMIAQSNLAETLPTDKIKSKVKLFINYTKEQYELGLATDKN